MDDIAIILGKHFRELRRMMGLTQRQQAKIAGYTSPQFVSNVERGNCLPPPKMLAMIIHTSGAPGKGLADRVCEVRSARYLNDVKKELLRLSDEN